MQLFAFVERFLVVFTRASRGHVDANQRRLFMVEEKSCIMLMFLCFCGCREQRVTGLMIHILIGLSTLLTKLLSVSLPLCCFLCCCEGFRICRRPHIGGSIETIYIYIYISKIYIYIYD